MLKAVHDFVHRLRFCGAQVGNQPLSLPEQRAHFALWALMKSPLLIGTDLVKASQQVCPFQA